MAITKTEVQVTWSASASTTVAQGGTTATSDSFSPDATAVELAIEIKANTGTPSADDLVDFYLLRTLGDPDGASTDEFETGTAGLFLGRLDCNITNPRISVVAGISADFKSGQIYAVNNSSTETITVSATIYEMRAA